MSTIEIQNKIDLKWLGASCAAAIISVGLGIGVGPVGIYWASGGGLAFAALGFLNQRKSAAAFAVIGLHSVLLIAGLALDALFLKPLSDEALQMPRLTQLYRDPGGFFESRIPAGWTTENADASNEAGVRIRPSDRQQYMGVSELTIRVREMANPTSDPVRFLSKMAEKISAKPQKDRTLFQFSTSPAHLLSGEQGMWSHLLVKRFWVPLYQLALYGIKEKRYLCTVSATGLKNHSTLAEILCLGEFQTIRIHPADHLDHS